MRILHITEKLGVGGTEILLSNTIPELTEFDHAIVYLAGRDNYQLPIFNKYPLFYLDHTRRSAIFRSVIRLRRILREYKPDIIHAHSFLASIISRLAKGKNTRLITTIHSVLSKDAFARSKFSLFVERLTSNMQDDLIAVSKVALDDYLQFVPFRGRRYVLYNFIPHKFSDASLRSDYETRESLPVRCVAVGGLKTVKNYHYLLDSFSLLPKGLFTLDVIGDGALRDDLEMRIIKQDLPVTILGNRQNVDELLCDYEIFLQASNYEGFGMAVCEGILSGLIPVLSDIPAHREITDNKAHYFELNNPMSLVSTLMCLKNRNGLMHLTSCRDYVSSITSPISYFQRLRDIYNSE